MSPGTLWRLARPRGMALVLALPAVRYGFAHWEGALPLRHPTAFAWVLAAWWCLSAGTLWLNAALDRDEGAVLMGSPVVDAVPAGIRGWGLAAQTDAHRPGTGPAAIPSPTAAPSAALAVAYSDPRTAWKAHPVLGPLVNVVGYGLLSPVAGFATVGVAPTLRTWIAALLVLCWVGATYFGAQAFQQREDAERGYRTFVVTHGPRATLMLTRALYAAAILGLVAGSVAGLFPRILASALLPGIGLDRHLAAWQRSPDHGFVAARGMLRRGTFLALWVMGAATADHVFRIAEGLPLAGLGTAWQPAR